MLPLFPLVSLLACGALGAPDIHVAFVVCSEHKGVSWVNRGEEAMTMVKSAILTAREPERLRFHIFADQYMHRHMEKNMPSSALYELYPVESAGVGVGIEPGKPCAGQKLLIPTLIAPSVPAAITVDTDILFTRDVGELWDHFSRFNSSQLMGMVAESEVVSEHYGVHSRAPFYEPFGLNSGVIMMHLSRLRQFRWMANLTHFHSQYHSSFSYGDQDLFNVLFHFNRDLMYRLPCEWNFRADHCAVDATSTCHVKAGEGIALLHGSRKAFHNTKKDATLRETPPKRPLCFKALYDAVKRVKIGAMRVVPQPSGSR